MEDNTQITGKVEYVPFKVLDKEYFYTSVTVDQGDQLPDQADKKQESVKNCFLMILDRSGSM